jgi:hypothetical protein
MVSINPDCTTGMSAAYPLFVTWYELLTLTAFREMIIEMIHHKLSS